MGATFAPKTRASQALLWLISISDCPENKELSTPIAPFFMDTALRGKTWECRAPASDF
jgi:hypothetical protein